MGPKVGMIAEERREEAEFAVLSEKWPFFLSFLVTW